MKNINKLLTALCVLFFTFAAPRAAFALDFGGIVTNDTSYQTYRDNKFYFDQRNSLSLWLRAPFDKSGENYFAVEAGYNFEGDFEKDEDRYTNVLDINLLEVAFAKNLSSSKIAFRAGRFYVADLSRMIFLQNADGVKFDFQNNMLKLSTYASYTGLLNAHNVKMIAVTPGQFLTSNNVPPIAPAPVSDKDKVYDLAEKYLIASATLSFPYLFSNQTIALELLGAFRLENETYNRMYATFSIDGPIWRSLFYNVSTTFSLVNYENINNEKRNVISNLTRIGVDYYFTKFSVGASGVYASGAQGRLSPFVGFTKNTSTYAYQDFLYSGIIKTGVNAVFKPIENLLLTANLDVIFNAAAGDANDKIEYYGFQYAAGVLWQIKNDFQLGVSMRQFIDKDDSSDVKKMYFGLSAALAF